MSKLEHFAIYVEPFGLEEDSRIYRIQVVVDGQKVQNIRTTLDIPPHMAEIDVISRMTMGIIEQLREKYE